MKNWFLTVTVAAMLLFFCQAAPADSSPFTQLSLEQAKTEAQKQHKYLIVELAESSFPACEQMNQTTWSTPKVQEWIKDNAIAVNLDVSQNTDLMRSFLSFEMPMILVFDAKDELHPLDRAQGFISSDTMLAWLNAVKGGKHMVDVLKTRVALLQVSGDKAESDARYDLALALMDNRDYPAATDEFVWLWQSAARNDLSGTSERPTMMTTKMLILARLDKQAKQRFCELRDNAEKNNRQDWIALNEIVAEDDKTLRWFDMAKKHPSELGKLGIQKDSLLWLLLRNKRWADAAVLYKEPIKELQSQYKSDLEKQERNKPKFSLFSRNAANMYACLLAAKRDREADEVAAESLKLEDTEEMRDRLVRTALKAHQPRDSQLDLLINLDHKAGWKARAYAKRGDIYANQELYSDAIKDFTSALKSDPKLSDAYLGRGTSFGNIDQYSLALRDLDRAIALRSTDPCAYNWRAWVYNRQKQYDKAIKDFGEVLVLDPKNVYALQERADLYRDHQHDWQKAIDDLTKCIAVDADDAYSFHDRGYDWEILKKPEQALKDYDQAIKLDPRDGSKYCDRGRVNAELKNYESSLSDFSKAIKLEKDCPCPYIGRGSTYWKMKQFDSALDDFNTAIRLDPKDADAYADRATVYQGQGDFQRAYSEANKALRLDPKNAIAVGNRGEASLKLGHYRSALNDLSKCIEREPDGYDGEAYYYRAEAYEKLGQPDLAKQDREKANKLGFVPD